MKMKPKPSNLTTATTHKDRHEYLESFTQPSCKYSV